MAGLPRRQLIVATAGTMMALLLASLDQTIVGTSLPRIVAELNGLDYYSWVITAYLVSSTTMVVVFRGVQGLFGGFLFASVFAVLADLFPPELRARMQGLFGAVFGISAIIGPAAGGWITEHLGWRWAFYVNVPVGAVAVILVVAGIPFVRSKASWRDIDFAGAATLAAGLVPLLIALSITRDHAWTSPEVMGLLGVAAVMLVTFFVLEMRAKEPIVPFKLFTNNVFAVSMIVAFLTALGMFGAIVFVPLTFQGVLGISITNSGLLLTPMMLGLIGASVVAGQVMVRIRYYRFIGTVGVAIMMVALFLLAQVRPGIPEWRVSHDLIMLGSGLGLTFPLYINAVQTALPARYLGVGSSQIQFWRNVGETVSSAVFGSILARQLPGHIQARVAELHLPPAARFPSLSGSAQSLFDPSHLAVLRAQVSPGFGPVFDQVIGAVRLALADTLSEIFLLALAVSSLALVASLLLKEVPLVQPAGGRPRSGLEESSAPSAAD